jgi:hypothetical protein
MGAEARAEYEARYAPDRTLERMAAVYARALRGRAA